MSEETPKKSKFVPIEVTPEQIAALEDQHEDVLVLRGSEMAPWVAVLRRPTRQEAIGYKTHGKRDSTTANEQLITRICVFPAKEDFQRQLARWPFFVDGIADSPVFKEFVGISVDADLK